jgi:hypothetical protein
MSCYLGNLNVIHEELAGGNRGVRVFDGEGMEAAVTGVVAVSVVAAVVVVAGSLPQAGKAAHEGEKCGGWVGLG